MTIKRHTGPADIVAVVSGAIGKRTPHATAFAQISGEPKFEQRLPTYHLDFDKLQLPNALETAQLTGWRMLITSDGPPRLAHVREKAGGSSFEDLSLPHNVLPQRLVAALALAEETLAARKEEFEPRLLYVPAIPFTALWLKGPEDLFIPLMEGIPAGSAPLKVVTSIAERLREGAARPAPPPGEGAHN